MTLNWILIASTSAVLICGVIAGVFLSFSDFVMKSLAASSSPAGAECMQIINRKVYHSLFLILLLGMAAASLALIIYAILTPLASASNWIISGGVAYFIGVFLVTMVFNVPMNNKLDILQPNTIQATGYWPEYAKNWTWWNHVRTIASTTATLCFLISTIILAGG